MEVGERKTSLLDPVCKRQLGSARTPHTPSVTQQFVGILTYIKHNPPRSPSAFANVDCAIVRRVGYDSEDLGRKSDGVAMGIGCLFGLAGGFS